MDRARYQRLGAIILIVSCCCVSEALTQDTRLSRSITTKQSPTRIYTISEEALRKMTVSDIIRDTSRIGTLRPASDASAGGATTPPESPDPSNEAALESGVAVQSEETGRTVEQIQQQLPQLRKIRVRKSDPGVQDAQLGNKLENIRRFKDWSQLNESYSSMQDGTPLRQMVPIFRASPMKFDPDRQVFRSFVRFALFDPSRQQASPLPEPMRFFFSSNNLDHIAPEELVFDSTNRSPRILELSDDNPRQPVIFQIYTNAQPDGVDIPVSVEAVLLFASSSRVLQGWGVESIPITVLLRGATLDETATINFDADLGSFSPQTLQLRGGEFATVRLRSQGTGDATIRVTSPQYNEQSLRMRYSFPLAFFLLALAGGLVGRVISWLLKKASDPMPVVVKYILGWTLFGLVASVLYLTLGINIIGIEVDSVDYFNEMLVFGIAALAPIAWTMLKGKEKPAP